ncbi:MAG TPA: hypothetical protein PLF31_02180 [Candidatus Paceibacterota bacterium]|nr:hypothetical protein [Candidatus Paceibacterota bacterium]
MPVNKKQTKAIKRKGTFIVLDGTDGTGKATQCTLLDAALKKSGYKIKKIDFPRYYDNFFGKLIGECLAGKYGDFIAVDPHIASVLYAADRWETKAQIEKWLEDGYVVISDRYVSANQIHQGGKILDEKKRTEFLSWLDMMEHGVFKIPRPDAIVYLNLSVTLGQKLLAEKHAAEALKSKKKYLGTSKDQAETNVDHLEKSRQSALSIVKKNNAWHKIECENNGEILSREAIHAEVLKVVSKILKKK